jgi:hypothetical protein
VALSISFDAHVVIFSLPKNISSATRQPYKVAISSIYFAFDINTLSFSGKNHVTHKAAPLDKIEILCTGSG